ncbi:XFP N-terminal domain-containing protein [Mycena olivaceomarginata]|nr:XFP N-terminal domain-containing protein [Mycena olivaceomarginata]
MAARSLASRALLGCLRSVGGLSGSGEAVRQMNISPATALPPSYPPWIEDLLSAFCPQMTGDRKGLEKLIANFSAWLSEAGTPGAIHEGGELASPPVPLWITQTSLYREGETETGPTATAWHGFKYIDPAESGAVLPIVHVKGFKISERTIYGFHSRADGQSHALQPRASATSTPASPKATPTPPCTPRSRACAASGRQGRRCTSGFRVRRTSCSPLSLPAFYPLNTLAPGPSLGSFVPSYMNRSLGPCLLDAASPHTLQVARYTRMYGDRDLAGSRTGSPISQLALSIIHAWEPGAGNTVYHACSGTSLASDVSILLCYTSRPPRPCSLDFGCPPSRDIVPKGVLYHTPTRPATRASTCVSKPIHLNELVDRRR